jgi:SDR family mycofactocin-dependent oxidoreductase
MGRVEGKVIAITGAARGQGRSHAVCLAEEGADIIAIDICEDIDSVKYHLGTAEELQETANLVEKAGRQVVTKQVDTRDRAALKVAIDDAVEQLGGHLDVVVANAGIGPVGPQTSIGTFADTVDVNLCGTLNTVHAALPHMGDNTSIILIGSTAAYIGGRGDGGPMGPGGIGYVYTKQMLTNYMEWFAPFLSPSGRRINIVHPTNVDTVMLHNEPMYRIYRPDLEHPSREEAVQAFPMLHGMPIPYIDPIDVSHAIIFLASDESRYVTGLQLRIDGGAIVKMGK